jgi:hypothetical protein
MSEFEFQIRINMKNYLWTMACLAIVGCSSPNVNPPRAAPDAGYVDFFPVMKIFIGR